MSTKNTLSLLSLSILSIAATPVAAQTFSPQLNGIILFEVENDFAYNSESEKSEINTLFATIEPYLILSLNDRIAIETSLVMEPLKKLNGGRSLVKNTSNNEFENQALFVEELKLSYFGDNYQIFAGKYNPSFGTAWDLAKGIVGKDFAKDYELKERIGAGANYTIDTPKTGTHTLTGNTFFLDTTLLSDSFITDRGRASIDDGGISNTEDFSSVSLTLDSENFAKIKGLNTHLGYYNQASGDNDTGNNNEIGYVAGAHYSFAPTGNKKKLSTTLLAEWARIRDVDGESTDNDYITGSAVIKFNKAINFTVAHTHRRIDEKSKDTVNDYQFQASTGYLFKNGISFDVGYRNTRISGVQTEGLESLLAYTYEF